MASLSALAPTLPVAVAVPSASVVVTPTAIIPPSLGFGVGLLFFILIFSFIWIILFSFKPSFVRRVERGELRPLDDAPADPARCFVAALIIALLIAIIAWMFRACK